MADQKVQCPHCRAHKVMSSGTYDEISHDRGHLLFVCTYCGGPIVYLVQQVRSVFKYESLSDVRDAEISIEKCGWETVEIWPKPTFNEEPVPDGLPDNVERMFQHSQKAAKHGGHELAILGFKRTLKLAQLELSPESKSDLRAWLLSLLDNGKLLANMREWVNRMKLQREPIEADALRAEEYAAFVYAILDQIFGMSSRIPAASR